MHRRSPARFLAPLALIAALFTIYTVVHRSIRTTDAATTTTSATGATTKARAKAKPASAGAKASARTYVVKPGDVLGTIATRTKVPVADLLRLNHLGAATTLRVGQKLKLAP